MRLAVTNPRTWLCVGLCVVLAGVAACREPEGVATEGDAVDAPDESNDGLAGDVAIPVEDGWVIRLDGAREDEWSGSQRAFSQVDGVWTLSFGDTGDAAAPVVNMRVEIPERETGEYRPRHVSVTVDGDDWVAGEVYGDRGDEVVREVGERGVVRVEQYDRRVMVGAFGATLRHVVDHDPVEVSEAASPLRLEGKFEVLF